MVDRWIDEGFGGEARRNYEDALSLRPDRPSIRALCAKALAELEQHERESAERRKLLLGEK